MNLVGTSRRAAVLLVIGATLLPGCATQGVSMVVAGQQSVELRSGSDQLPTGNVDFFVLSPLDTVQVYVLPKKLGDPDARLDCGNAVRVALSFSGKSYSIMPGDQLSIRSDSEPDKVLQAEVRPDGYITMPQLSREVHAAGLMPKQLATVIAHQYAGIMIAPKISVAVEKSAIDQLLKLDGSYPVNRDGLVVLPTLGKFDAAGKTTQALSADIAKSAGEVFHNPISVSVSMAQLTGRDVDARLDPDGQQYFRSAVKIAPDGTLFLPQAGAIAAAGNTLSQLRTEIVAQLQPFYKNPIDASVTLLESGNMNVFVGGEVKQPGRYPYTKSMTILQVLASAGWISEWGDIGNAIVMHPSDKGRYVVYRANLNAAIDGTKSEDDLKLSPRDIVIVPRSDIAKVDLFIDQYVRKFLPFNLDAAYSYGQGAYNTHSNSP